MQSIAGWRGLVAAARASGLRDIPDPTASIGPALARPASGQIDDTAPNRSEGARLIVKTSARLSLSYRPLVVVTGGRLTTSRTPTSSIRPSPIASSSFVDWVRPPLPAARWPRPNGEMDPWADAIVTARFRYGAGERLLRPAHGRSQLAPLSELPANPFGEWIAAKQPKIWDLPVAADQVAVIAVGIPSFATKVERVSATALVAAGATAGPIRGRSERPRMARHRERERRSHRTFLERAPRSADLSALTRDEAGGRAPARGPTSRPRRA